MEDNVSWPPRSKDRFGIWKHLLKQIWFTEAINVPQKRPNMELYSMFSQPYIQCPVQARAYDAKSSANHLIRTGVKLKTEYSNLWTFVSRKTFLTQISEYE